MRSLKSKLREESGCNARYSIRYKIIGIGVETTDQKVWSSNLYGCTKYNVLLKIRHFFIAMN